MKIIMCSLLFIATAFGMHSPQKTALDRYKEIDEEYDQAFDELADSCTMQCCLSCVRDPYVTSPIIGTLLLNNLFTISIAQAAATCATASCVCLYCTEHKHDSSWNTVKSVQSMRVLKSEMNDSLRAFFPYLFTPKNEKRKQE